MKNIVDFLNEQFEDYAKNIVESKIESEKDFREVAEKKFKETFGDELDKDQMEETINGILNDHKELVEAGEWGELIGILNKSFAN